MILFTDGQYTEANPGPACHHRRRQRDYDSHDHVWTEFRGPVDRRYAEHRPELGGQHLHAPNPTALSNAFRDIAASISMLIE